MRRLETRCRGAREITRGARREGRSRVPSLENANPASVRIHTSRGRSRLRDYPRARATSSSSGSPTDPSVPAPVASLLPSLFPPEIAPRQKKRLYLSRNRFARLPFDSTARSTAKSAEKFRARCGICAGHHVGGKGDGREDGKRSPLCSVNPYVCCARVCIHNIYICIHAHVCVYVYTCIKRVYIYVSTRLFGRWLVHYAMTTSEI